MCTWEDVTTKPNVARLLETVRSLLDPYILANTQLPNHDSSLQLPSYQPTTPSPSPPPIYSLTMQYESAIHTSSVDFNENDQGKKHSPTKIRKETFPPTPSIAVEHAEEKNSVKEKHSCLAPNELNTKSLLKVSWSELWLSHCMLAVILMTAIVSYRWLPIQE